MALLRVGALPDEALAAAAEFHAVVLPRVLAELQGAKTLTLVFAPADHTHRAWRLAAVQGLARQHAPVRVNALAGDDEAAIGAALSYLDKAEGVTGQYLLLDGNGAVALLSRQDDQ
ncbi:Rossmann fold domain-containing protein [Novosphingobium sp. G106]|uniref:Rossmann fold domain-containing protein n=1 Tax=Novosphingobium sp. G106 TaxID=2849500 RepID=UPI0020C223CE|nr:hypothetical protein [Novosphingobium sp. G106]